MPILSYACINFFKTEAYFKIRYCHLDNLTKLPQGYFHLSKPSIFYLSIQQQFSSEEENNISTEIKFVVTKGKFCNSITKHEQILLLGLSEASLKNIF